MGTPYYMSPEQCEGKADDRPPRRHLLAGRDPVRDADRQGPLRRRRLRRDHRQAHHRGRRRRRAPSTRCCRLPSRPSSCARWPSRATSASRRWRSSARPMLDPEGYAASAPAFAPHAPPLAPTPSPRAGAAPADGRTAWSAARSCSATRRRRWARTPCPCPPRSGTPRAS